MGKDYKTARGLSLEAEAPTGRLPVTRSHAVVDSCHPVLLSSLLTCSFSCCCSSVPNPKDDKLRVSRFL